MHAIVTPLGPSDQAALEMKKPAPRAGLSKHARQDSNLRPSVP